MIPINKQEPLKADHGDGSTLLVHSIFHTIQGEGPHVGKPAVFIRLAGCNLQCPGCDTEYVGGIGVLKLSEIIDRVAQAWLSIYESPRSALKCAKLPLVVITGGEPFRQAIGKLVRRLDDEGYKTQIETNGTLGFAFDYDHHDWPADIVVSPKAGKVHRDLLRHITAYKYVLDSDHISEDDGLPTSVLGMPAAPARPHPGFEGDVYVQPADEAADHNPFDWKNRKNLAATIKSAMKYGYRLCIQTHKVVGLE